MIVLRNPCPLGTRRGLQRLDTFHLEAMAQHLGWGEGREQYGPLCVPQMAQATGPWLVGDGVGSGDKMETQEKNGSRFTKISEAGQHRAAWAGEVGFPMQVTLGTF